MSTPPKEPKPDELRRGGAAPLESTYLGVAPAAPEPAAATGSALVTGSAGVTGAAGVTGSAGVAGSAIIATPMISVSDRGKRGDAASPQPVSPQAISPQAISPQAGAPQAVSPQQASPPVVSPQAAVPGPARPTGLQGGWQSAGIPRALGPEQTALHGSPGAWPMPPVAAPAGPRQQPPAAAPTPPTPQAPVARAATPNPSAVAGLQHTALASDYLRGARDAARGAEAAPPQRPAAPVQPNADIGRQTAYSPVAAPEAQRAHWQDSPAPRVPLPVGDMNATAASGGPASPPPASPPPTAGPPPTAELSSPAPLPFQTASHTPLQVSYAEPERERGPSPRSMGTQASIAPPPGELGASFHGPMAPAVQDVAPAVAAAAARATPGPSLMAAVASPVRNAIPQALVGTMLDRTPSVPGRELPQGSPPPPANPTLRFEQVPAPRSSLAQQATSFGLNIPIEHNTTHWGRPAHDGKTKALPGRRAKGRSQWRMIVLAALALLSVAFAAFGPELRDFALAELNRRKPDPRGPSVASADQATQTTLNNLPSPGARVPAAGEVEAAAGVAAAAAAAAASPPTAAAGVAIPLAAAEPSGAESVAAALPAVEATPVAGPEPAAGKPRRGAKGRTARALAEAAAAVTPESKLAAEAGRHVLAARFADALPLYRTLQRDYPQNTAYAAMTKVLEQKLSGAERDGAHP